MQLTDVVLQLGLAGISLIANTLSAFAGGGAGLVQLPALILLVCLLMAATHKIASVAGFRAAGRHWRGQSRHVSFGVDAGRWSAWCLAWLQPCASFSGSSCNGGPGFLDHRPGD